MEEITVHTAAGDTPLDIGEALAPELVRGRISSVCNLGAAVAAVHGAIGTELLVGAWRMGRMLRGLAGSGERT